MENVLREHLINIKHWRCTFVRGFVALNSIRASFTCISLKQCFVSATPQILAVRNLHKHLSTTKTIMVYTSVTFGSSHCPDAYAAQCLFLKASGTNQITHWQLLADDISEGTSLLTFLLLSSSACVRTDSSFSSVASVLWRTPSFSSSFCTTNSWASTWTATAAFNS